MTVDGGLLQYPTFPRAVLTPVLVFHRGGGSSTAPAPGTPSTSVDVLRRAFARVALVSAAGPGPGMPRASAGEWDAIVRWWAGEGRWRNRMAMELTGEAVAVVGLQG